jgi:hypothetical protein
METEGRKPIVLRNGTLKDPVTGHFLSGPVTGKITSSEMGSQMARRRHEKARVAARIALAEAAERKGVQRSAVAAVGLLAGKAFDGAVAGFEGEEVQLADGGSYNKRDLRGGKEAAKFALQLAGLLEDERQQLPAGISARLEVSAEGVAFLRELLGRSAGQIVEGEAREVEE